jgi:hypothetical protein
MHAPSTRQADGDQCSNNQPVSEASSPWFLAASHQRQPLLVNPESTTSGRCRISPLAIPASRPSRASLARDAL